MKTQICILASLLVAMTAANPASAADNRTGVITEVRSSDSGKVLVKIDHSSSNLCGNNSATAYAYVKDDVDHFESHRTVLLAAFMSGREVVLNMDDTGNECRINMVTMVN